VRKVTQRLLSGMKGWMSYQALTNTTVGLHHHYERLAG
jgi:hypothetical protein